MLITMSDEAQTKPTIETVLERINALGQDLRAEIGSVRTDLSTFRVAVEDRLEQIEIRLDRTQEAAHGARADVRELRAELRARFKQPA
jgi:chaperonin cofactor prefoldin